MVGLSLLLAALLADIGPEPPHAVCTAVCTDAAALDPGAADDGEDDMPHCGLPPALTSTCHCFGPADPQLQTQTYLRRTIRVLFGVWIC